MDLKPVFFATAQDFRNWLHRHHETHTELLVGFYRVKSGRASMSWPESVDEALCYGWIDGVRRSIDEQSYSIRFTPRKKDSIWSAVNIKKVEVLKDKGLMMEAGLKAYSFRTEKKSAIYSHESEMKELSEALQQRFELHEEAWGFFNAQAPSYKKRIIHWIMSAKQEATRLSRLQKTITASTAQEKIGW